MPRLRPTLALLALGPILWVGWQKLDFYFNSAECPRPHDFLQVWAAGTLVVNGDNPYDSKKMYELQRDNRNLTGYASMMWVPPWGLVITFPLALLPITVAQIVWVFGQLALMLFLVTVLWKLYGGASERRWVAVAVAMLFGPMWWQVTHGQYAGLMLLGLTGYLIAHRRNRPVLAGACLFFVALKPHLFPLLAIGMLIDGVRSPFGRRVVLGGAVALGAAAIVVTAVNPECWQWYHAAARQSDPSYAPSLSQWLPPTIHGQLRLWLPGQPFWVQFVPVALIAPVFAVYWWRHGNPSRWPQALLWLIPLQLLTAPYGSWPSDWALLLLPLTALAVRLDAVGWNVRHRWHIGVMFVATTVAVMALAHFNPGFLAYTWILPAFVACMYWANHSLNRPTWNPQPAPETVTGVVRAPAVPKIEDESVPASGAAF